MQTLILSDEEVRGLLEVDEVIRAVEEAFKEKAFKRAIMPPKVYVNFQEFKGDLRVMPCYLPRLRVSSVKVVNVHPLNPKTKGLPTVMAVVILIDPQTGLPLAVMSGTTITDFRTGAAGAIAAKCLAKSKVEVVGLIGAGRQARTQLMGLFSVYGRLREVKVYDLAKSNLKAFIEYAEARFQDKASFREAESPREAVEGSDIVVTATPSTKPIVKDEWVSPGVHFNCIGADAPGKEELDPMILKRAKIVVDDYEQGIHSGELNVPNRQGIIRPEDIYSELGEIVAGLKPGRESEEEITVFTSTGLAIQDAVTAKLVYDKALSRGLGVKMNLVL